MTTDINEAFCKFIVQSVYRLTNGRRMLDWIRDIVGTERWNSFDKFEKTTRYLEREYIAGGAAVETHRTQTGGQIGTGRWVIHQAWNVNNATLDIVHPIRRRLADYKDNPWHIIQWSASTPRSGINHEIVILDELDQIEQLRPQSLLGKMILIRTDPRPYIATIARAGAVGVISDWPVPENPNAVRWLKFGWGGLPVDSAATALVGLALSQRQGEMLRQFTKRHGTVKIRTKVDVRQYVGWHKTVTAVIRGREKPEEEIWAIAHSHEPGALDNASGVAVCLEIVHVLEYMISQGLLPRPKRSIRFINGYECYGTFDYLEQVKQKRKPLAGVCIDTVGAKPKACGGRLEWHATIPMSAGFVNRLGNALIRAAIQIHNPGYQFHSVSFMSTPETLVGDPKYGFPCPWITNGVEQFDAYHTSADQPSLVSSTGLKIVAAAMAGYLYYLADAGNEEVKQMAGVETTHTQRAIRSGRINNRAVVSNYLREQHHASIEHLKLWVSGHGRQNTINLLDKCKVQIDEQQRHNIVRRHHRKPQKTPMSRLVPRRRVPLVPRLDNVPPDIAQRILKTGLEDWALFWADGKRTLADITQLLSCEYDRKVHLSKVGDFFLAHKELGYVDL